jgi:hypothetical protein
MDCSQPRTREDDVEDFHKVKKSVQMVGAFHLYRQPKMQATTI